MPKFVSPLAVALFFLCTTANVDAVKKNRKFAVARPFVAQDFEDLQASFAMWPDPPCDKRQETDVYLIYDKDLSKKPAMLSGVQDLTDLVQDLYSHCFAKVEFLSCDISEADNAYLPSKQDERQNWVSGPNHQFHCTYRSLQEKGYEYMYLMEADSVPLKPFWLDSLVEETEKKHPFVMLGSHYHGDKWNSFKKVLPQGLLRHINGNAVYSLKDARLDRIVEQMEGEVNTSGHGVPYDYRIAQIVIQAKEGPVAHFPKYPGFAMPNQDEVLDYLGFDDSDVEDVLKTTKLIGNYAATNMVEEYFDPHEILVHGARMFDSWKTSPHSGSLSLVVSDYSANAPYTALFEQMDQIKTHPFDHLLLALPSSVEASDEISTHIPWQVFNRREGEDSLYDYCAVLPYLQTEWFVLTEAHTRMTNKMTLMVTKEDGKPLASFADPDIAKCFGDKFCFEELSMSWQFHPNNNRIFRSDDTVFSVAHMKEFCTKLDGRRPSATAYFAFLKQHGIDESLYEFSDRAVYGSRLPFRQFNHTSDAADTIVPLVSQRFLQTNFTDCEDRTTESECEAGDGCVWDGSFGECSDDPDADTVDFSFSMTISPVDLEEPTPEDIQALVETCEEFVGDSLSTVVSECIPTVVFVPAPDSGTNLVLGSYVVTFEVTALETETLTTDNAAEELETVLENGQDDFLDTLVDKATSEQGTASGLDLATEIQYDDIIVEEDGCKGIFKVFCIIGKAFGDFASFLLWVLDIITFGIFS